MSTLNHTTFITSPPGAHAASARLTPRSTSTTSLPSSLTTALQPRVARAAPCDPAALPSTAQSLLSVPMFPPPSGLGAAGRRVVLWFRADLRLHDHPALTHAVEEAAAGGAVLPVFCFDPRSFGKTAFGFEKTGRYRAKFLVESVQELRDAFRAKGSDLVVRLGKPEEVLPAICRRVGAHVVMCHKEVSYEEKKLERILEVELDRAGVEFHPLWANTLYHVDDLPFPFDEMPDVYTKFREVVQSRAVIRDPLLVPREMPRMPRVDAGKVPTLPELGLTEPTVNAYGVHKIQGGEKEALQRLSLYVKETVSIPDVKSSAARHLGADFSCHISPWLALGCVSPRTIYDELKKNADKAGLTISYFELIWRDFFRFITSKYNRTKVTQSNPSFTNRIKSSGVTNKIPAMTTS